MKARSILARCLKSVLHCGRGLTRPLCKTRATSVCETNATCKRVCLLAILLCLWSSPLWAKPTATFSGYSETLLRYYQQEDVDRIKNLLAFIEILSFSAKLPKIEDLSLHLSGWGQLDIIDVSNQNRWQGDLSLAMVAYRDPKMRFQAFLGRQYVYQNNKMLHFDGARVEARASFGLGIRAFAGWVVRPQFAPSFGYFMAGARVSQRLGHNAEFGITFLEMLEEGRPAHEVLGVDFLVVPFRWMEISGSASADLFLMAVRQVGGRIDLNPLRWLRVSLGYEYAMPSAFVSKNSIFSVFSNNAFHEGYVQAWVYLFRRRLAIGTDLRLIYLPDEPDTAGKLSATTSPSTSFPTGEQYRLYLRLQYSKRPSGWIGLTLERLRDQADGHVGGRLFWQQRWSSLLFAADVQYYYYSRQIRGYAHSIYSSLSSQWSFATNWSLTGSIQFTLNPFLERSWLGLLKLSYRFYAAVPSTAVTPKQAGTRNRR